MATKPMRPCLICGKPFTPFFRLAKEQPTCGGVECKKAWRRLRESNNHKAPDIFTCDFCGEKYLSHKGERQVTCGSKYCQSARKYERKLELLAERADVERKDALKKLKQLRTSRLYDRKRREARA